MAAKKTLFSFSETCSIIKLCGESRVAELKLGDFYVTFHTPVGEGPQKHVEIPATQPTHPDAEISEEQRKQLEKHALMEDEIRLKEDRLDQMLIESPSEFEALQAQGDLDEEEAGNVDDGETHDRRPESALQRS